MYKHSSFYILTYVKQLHDALNNLYLRLCEHLKAQYFMIQTSAWLNSALFQRKDWGALFLQALHPGRIWRSYKEAFMNFNDANKCSRKWKIRSS